MTAPRPICRNAGCDKPREGYTRQGERRYRKECSACRRARSRARQGPNNIDLTLIANQRMLELSAEEHRVLRSKQAALCGCNGNGYGSPVTEGAYCIKCARYRVPPHLRPKEFDVDPDVLKVFNDERKRRKYDAKNKARG